MQEIEISSIKFNRGIIYICRRYATNNAAIAIIGHGIVRDMQVIP